MITNDRYAIGYSHTCQTSTALERRAADARYGIGNYYAPEIFAIFKRGIADARYGKSVISAYYDIGFGARVADTGYRVALAVLVKREYQTFSAFRIFFNVMPGCVAKRAVIIFVYTINICFIFTIIINIFKACAIVNRKHTYARYTIRNNYTRNFVTISKRFFA